MGQNEELASAVAVLSARALEVRGLYAEYEKAAYGREWSIADVMAGFVVDVGDLMRLVMASDGRRQLEDVEEKLAHELSDCLWSVLVLASRLNLDLGSAFATTMAGLEQRLLDAASPPG